MHALCSTFVLMLLAHRNFWISDYTTNYQMSKNSAYCIAGKISGGKFDKFNESSMIHQTKTIQISTYN